MEQVKTRSKNHKLLRKHKLSFLFNELEQSALENYCKKYKVDNRSKFMRETIVTAILTQFDKDYPSLFDCLEAEKEKSYKQGVLTF
jgi:hypothetical protein